MGFQTLSEKQLLALSWWNRPDYRDYDGIICDGAVRSGKTVAMCVGFFLWSMTGFHNGAFALCGRSIGSLQRNILRELPQWLGSSFRVRHNRAQNLLTVSAGGHTNRYYLFGGQDEGSYASIQGMTLSGVLLDEVVLMSRSFVEQACARCSVEGARLWFNCNPAGPEHWFYKEWICKAREKNTLRLHFTMQDNPGLSESVRQRYQRMYTGVFYKRYVLGQWCLADGLIYAFDREKHLAKAPEKGQYYISVDYGTMNPFSAGLWCVSDGKAVRIREYYYCGRDRGVCLTDQEYYDQLCKLAGELPVEQVIVDPSAASFITLIRKRGRFSVRKARNDVLGGIRLVSSLLQAGVVQVTEDCPDIIREFSLYCWEESGQDRPVKENDHAMDDMRYFCSTVLGRGAV